MLFNTVQYLIFLPIVVLIYYILPPKVRYVWLLGASCYFYMQWNKVYLLLLLFCTIVTYTGETVRKPLRGDNRILNVGLSPKQS
ncbi:MAG: hypothetical protein K1W38_00035, partial [Lachnospiraceae bacterium]